MCFVFGEKCKARKHRRDFFAKCYPLLDIRQNIQNIKGFLVRPLTGYIRYGMGEIVKASLWILSIHLAYTVVVVFICIVFQFIAFICLLASCGFDNTGSL